jgi:hypothetical protein
VLLQHLLSYASSLESEIIRQPDRFIIPKSDIVIAASNLCGGVDFEGVELKISLLFRPP